MILRIAPSSILACLAFAALVPAQRDLASVFPADSWAFVEFAGLDAGNRAFQAAKLVGIARQALGDEGWQAVENAVRQQGGRDLAEARGVFARVGIAPQQVRRLLAGAIAVGVGRPTMMGDKGMPSIALVAAIGSGDDARQAVAALERVATEKAPRPLPKSTRQVGGIECTALTLPRKSGQILHVVHDGLWFVSNSPGYLAECLTTVRGQTPSLTDNAALSHGRGQLPGTRMAGLFLNLHQFDTVLEPFMPYEVAGLGRALGICGAPDLFVACAHDGKSAHDVIELTVPGPDAGLLKAPFRKPVTNRAAQWVKPSTALFVSLSLDGASALEAVERLLASLPAEISAEARANFDRAVQRDRIPVQELTDAFAILGPELSLAVDTPQPAPPFVAFVEVRDPARAQQLVQRMIERSGHGEAMRFEEQEGIKVWSTEVRMGALRMSPTLALRDGWLVCSNFKNAAMRTLRAGALGAESLAADPRFLAAANAAEGAALFATGRLQPLLDGFWGLAVMGIKTGANAMGIELADLPDAGMMAEALDDVVVIGRASEQGFSLKVQQPLGMGAVLPAVTSALDWLLTADLPAAASRPAVKTSKKIY